MISPVGILHLISNTFLLSKGAIQHITNNVLNSQTVIREDFEFGGLSFQRPYKLDKINQSARSVRTSTPNRLHLSQAIEESYSSIY